MRYRKQTGSGDYIFGNGQLDFYRDVPEAVGQAVKSRLLLWLGEWFLDITEGTPYLQGILGKHPKSLADTTIRDRALGTQGMRNIENYVSTIDPDPRRLSVQFSINTIYGPTALQISNYVNF